MWQIKKSVLINAMSAAKNYYPDEFMCFLGGDRKTKTINEIVLVPTENTKNSASINELTIPFDETIVGTLHSHPNENNTPSNADKKFFRKYTLNIILGYPYDLTNASFYDENAKIPQVEIIED